MSAVGHRFSFNQGTSMHRPLDEILEAARRAHVPAIGLWRHAVAEIGASEAALRVSRAGLDVSSLCRGGFFTSSEPNARAKCLDDNRKAVREAAAVGANVLVLVCGGIPDQRRGLEAARRAVSEVLDELVPFAQREGVRLAVEPMHPMFCSDRSVVVTLAQALELVAPYPSDTVGVMIDAYHVWWDPDVWSSITLAGPRVFGFQVSDWTTPLPADILVGRGLPGDGCIDLRALRRAVDATGYSGYIEAEIFNEALWNAPAGEVVPLVRQRTLQHAL